jgi:hypothetical protein
MKARAILNGRLSCKPEDLFVLELLTTFRTPPDVHENVPKLIEDVLSGNLPLLDERQLGLDRQDEEQEDEEVDSGPKEHDEDGDGDDEDGDGDSDSGVSSDSSSSSNDSDSPSSSSQEGNAAAADDHSQGIASEEDQEKIKAGNGAAGDQVPTQREELKGQHEHEENTSSRKDGPDKEPTARPFKPFNEIQSPTASKSGRHSDQDVVSNVDVILQALRGKLFGGAADMKEHLGGSPRRWASSRGLTDMRHSNCVETALWFDRPSPSFPRKQWRGDSTGGGRVAIVRDTSRSMHGAWATWASALTSKIIEMGRRKKMQIGYLEFNHDITAPEGTFFTNRYTELASLARRVDCQGGC